MVTGLGVVSEAGIGPDALWRSLVESEPPVGHREVVDFDPTRWFSKREIRRLERFTQVGVAAGLMAAEDAGLYLREGRAGEVYAELDVQRCGVLFGSGGCPSEQAVVDFHAQGEIAVSPLLTPNVIPSILASHSSIRLGWQGPSETVHAACATGNIALGSAARRIVTGEADVMLVGAAQMAIFGLGLVSMAKLGVFALDGVMRPFDPDRSGFVNAEGGAALVLEGLDHARRRGARILAEVKGWSSTADAHGLAAPAPEGVGSARCISVALAHAGVAPEDIGQINAHGTATKLNDQTEAKAVNVVFGTPGPPITSTKPITGHLGDAAGAMEAVCVVLSIGRGIIPPTRGHRQMDPEFSIDLVTEPRSWSPGVAISNGLGLGGHNACVVFGPPPQ